MAFYFLVLFSISILFVLIHYSKNKDIKSLIYYLGPVFILILVSGLRDGVGRDYYGYKYIFANINLINNIEIGYYYLNLFLKNNGLSFSYVIFISSFITILFIFMTIKKFSKMWFLSFFIFFTNFNLYFQSFSAIRQYIAISIFFFSIKYIINKQLYKFLICVFIGFLFHKSILLIIPFYFLLNINYSKFQMILLLALSFIIQKLNLAVYIIKSIKDLLPSKYLVYISTIDETTVSFNVWILFLFKLSFFLFILLVIDRKKNNNIFLNGYFYYFLINLATKNFIVFSRISWYFEIFSVILIPNFIYYFNSKSKNLIITVFILVYLLMFLAHLYLVGVEPWRVIPYNNIIINI